MILNEAIEMCRLQYLNKENDPSVQRQAMIVGCWLTELREYKKLYPNFKLNQDTEKKWTEGEKEITDKGSLLDVVA